MYEPITIVRVRKATKVTIPAGGWLMLYGPETPLHQQLAARSVLVKEGNVNEDYFELQVGRIQDSSSPVKFLTSAQQEATAAQQKETQENLRKSNEQAIALQKKRDEEEAAAKAEAHKAQVEKLNEAHAKLAKSNAAAPAPAPKIETE